jgi:exosortase/archaeosortase family protein
MQFRYLAYLGLALVSMALAFEPATWLWQTWTDPSWNSDGEFAFLGVLAVFLWSATSRGPKAEDGDTSWTWLGISAVVRAMGNLLAVNVLSALMLCVDVYAIGRVFRLDSRERAASPAWLAIAFAFCLPVERILQRLLGHVLQWVSARGAYVLLQLFESNARLDGMELSVNGVRVLVDLPCSGARGLTVLALLFVLLAAVRRPNWVATCQGALIVVLSATLSNTIRVFLLAEGIIHRSFIGLDVMAQPWHDVVGMFCLFVGLLPLLWWSRQVRPTTSLWKIRPPRPRFAAVLMVIGLASLAFIPARPIDVSGSVDVPTVPAFAYGYRARIADLTAMEKSYFTAFGGGAARASYGPLALLVVRTSSPVRHLHSPEECMAGAGWEVTRLGITGRAYPGATWRISRNDEWLDVRATYISSRGDQVETLEEAIWLWLTEPGLVWTAVERAYPVDAPEQVREAFDTEIFHRLNMREENK